MQRRYSIYEAKAKLSKIIRLVKQDRPIIITERGRDVARMVPAGDGQSLDERIAALTTAGMLTDATAPPRSIRRIARRRGALKRFLDERG